MASLSFRQCVGSVEVIIAGGCYRETCEIPVWDAIYGSGGRAAAALANLASKVELHTYRPFARRTDLFCFDALGVEVLASPCAVELAFAYLHPLSQPLIFPDPATIAPEAPLQVQGDVVLRFGFIEGDAVIDAGRAVYDPQTTIAAAPFGANGSRADALAVVMNEREMLAAAAVANLTEAAKRVMARNHADVLIAKAGIRGAHLYVRGGEATWIPPFRSERVFKIGSGDVFSAAFAYYWGDQRLDPRAAAELASRSVAAYCSTRKLPLPSAQELPRLPPVGAPSSRRVQIVGSADTLASCWLLEEARWRLVELGLQADAIKVSAEERAEAPAGEGPLLVLGDGLLDGGAALIKSIAGTRPTVLFRESPTTGKDTPATASVTSDFTTALYWTGWA